MKKFLTTVVAFITYFSATAQIASEQDDAILDKIKSGNEKYVSITSDFKQNKHLAYVKEDVVSEGKFFYEKSDKLAMKYVVPAGDFMIMNGDRCVMSSSGKITGTSLKSSAKIRKIKAILSASLNGNVREMNAKKIVCTETAQHFIVTAELNEKNKTGVINKVVIHYNTADYSLSILKTEEPDGSYTVYELIDKIYNRAIDANEFNTKRK